MNKKIDKCLPMTTLKISCTSCNSIRYHGERSSRAECHGVLDMPLYGGLESTWNQEEAMDPLKFAKTDEHNPLKFAKTDEHNPLKFAKTDEHNL